MVKQRKGGLSQRLLTWIQLLVLILMFWACCKGGYMPRYDTDIGSRDQQLLLLLYAVVLVSLEKNYSALRVGLLRVSELIYSQGLAVSISAAFMYMVASIYYHQLMPIIPMILLLLIQGVFCVVWTYIANAQYFRTHRRPKTAIIYRSLADKAKIESIRYYNEHFDVQKEIENPPDDIHALMKELEGFKVVFVAGVNATLRNGIVKFCVEQDMHGYIVPHLGDIIMGGAEYLSMFSVPIMKVERAEVHSEYLVFKRIMDIALALIGTIFTGPIMLAAACAIRCYDGGPALYKQTRLTKDGRTFEIYKFRSMRVDAEKDGVARLASENDDRITPIGKFIRATRIDELPQLINILRGDMSIVGPRPERPEIAEQYIKQMPEFSLRLQVKAGLTGMAQVYGRYNTEPYSKLQMDLMYVNEMSLRTDIRLILATIKILFMRESTQGIQNGQTTAADGYADNRKSA